MGAKLYVIDSNKTIILTAEYEQLKAATEQQNAEIYRLQRDAYTLDAKVGQAAFDVGFEAGKSSLGSTISQQNERIKDLEAQIEHQRAMLTSRSS